MISTATTARSVIARRRTRRRWCPSTRGHAGDGSGSVTAGLGGAAGMASPWRATVGLGCGAGIGSGRGGGIGSGGGAMAVAGRAHRNERLSKAAATGHASLYASGIFPGFASDELALLMTTQSRSIRIFMRPPTGETACPKIDPVPTW